MTRITVLLLAVLLVLDHDAVRGSPMADERNPEDLETQRNTRVFRPDSKDWMNFHHSWSLPSFPSIPSVSSLFKDDEDDTKTMRKRIEALEKSHKEVLGVLRKLVAVQKSQPCYNTDKNNEAVQLSNDNNPPKVPEKVEAAVSKPENNGGISSDKEGSAIQGTKNEETQSGSSMKGDKTDALAPAKNDDKGDIAPTTTKEEENTPAPVKKDEKEANVPTEESAGSETVLKVENEKKPTSVPATEEAGKPEKNEQPQENEKQQVDPPKVEKIELLQGNEGQKDDTPPEVNDTNEEKKEESNKDSQKEESVGNGDEAQNAELGSIVAFENRGKED